MGTLPANLNIPNCINVNFNKPQGKMKIAVLCLVMVLLVVIKAASMKKDQEMNIEGDDLQEMNIEKRADGKNYRFSEIYEDIERRSDQINGDRLFSLLDFCLTRHHVYGWSDLQGCLENKGIALPLSCVLHVPA